MSMSVGTFNFRVWNFCVLVIFIPSYVRSFARVFLGILCLMKQKPNTNKNNTKYFARDFHLNYLDMSSKNEEFIPNNSTYSTTNECAKRTMTNTFARLWKMEAAHKQSTNEIFRLLSNTIIHSWSNISLCTMCILFNCTLVQFLLFSMRKTTKEVESKTMSKQSNAEQKTMHTLEIYYRICESIRTLIAFTLSHARCAVNGPGQFFLLLLGYYLFSCFGSELLILINCSQSQMITHMNRSLRAIWWTNKFFTIKSHFFRLCSLLFSGKAICSLHFLSWLCVRADNNLVCSPYNSCSPSASQLVCIDDLTSRLTHLRYLAA